MKLENLPKNKKEQFKDVAFVEQMSNYSLKVYIKNLHQILHQFANAMDTRRPDVATAIDNILDGETFREKDLDEHYIYAMYHEYMPLKMDDAREHFMKAAELDPENEMGKDAIAILDGTTDRPHVGIMQSRKGSPGL